MDINATIYDLATKGVSTQASLAAVESQLPGRENGPADAYRHVLLAAELTRRFGEDYAKKLLDGHEWTGNNDGQTPNQEAMDKHNNDIGVEIGNRLRDNPSATWNDVVKEAQKKFDSNENSGSGARWLPESDWKKNPVGDDGKRIPNGDSRLNWPPAWEKRLPIGDANGNNIPDIHEGNWKLPKNPINPRTNTKWNDSKNWIRRVDPLTFDLDNDGFETVGASSTNPILFDHDGDGTKNGTGWIASDDAMLVLDRNGNGTIDSGRELFGDSTIKSNGQTATDDFDALADIDSNADGVINSQDAQFTNLRLWRDLNQDGISQTGELFTLNDLGIASINITNTANSQTLANGNQIANTGTYTKADGTTGSVADINLANDTFHRQFGNVLNTTTVANLPDMQGSGAVRDLREAANDGDWRRIA